MKGMLPVHCCCEPGRHLGWLPLPGTAWPEVVRFCRLDAEPVVLRVRVLHVPSVGRHLAFDSGHQPIEVLRLLPGWRDA